MKNINEDTPALVLSTLDDRARDRVTSVQKHLRIAGFRNVRIVQARTPESEDFQQNGLPPVLQGRWRADLQQMWGTAACALSHLDFLKTPVDQLPIIVFEDDAIIHPDFFLYLGEIEIPAEIDWDICHLSYWNDNLGRSKNPDGVVNKHLLWCAPGQCAAMHSYILNHPVYDRIVPLQEEIDCHLANLTRTVHCLVVEHDPLLTSPDFQMGSVRHELDDLYRNSNNNR